MPYMHMYEKICNVDPCRQQLPFIGGGEMLYTIATVLLIISSLILIASILLQSGKSAGLSGSIGGGAEQIWGKNKARDYDAKFDKVTKVAAVFFIISSLMMAYIQ